MNTLAEDESREAVRNIVIFFEPGNDDGKSSLKYKRTTKQRDSLTDTLLHTDKTNTFLRISLELLRDLIPVHGDVHQSTNRLEARL